MCGLCEFFEPPCGTCGAAHRDCCDSYCCDPHDTDCEEMKIMEEFDCTIGDGLEDEPPYDTKQKTELKDNSGNILINQNDALVVLALFFATFCGLLILAHHLFKVDE